MTDREQARKRITIKTFTIVKVGDSSQSMARICLQRHRAKLNFRWIESSKLFVINEVTNRDVPLHFLSFLI